MLSVSAGMMIAMGGVIYLSVGSIVGALLFSMGLLTILTLKFELFTGKAGLLATNEMRFGKLTEIWFGNLLGTFFVAAMLSGTPVAIQLAEKASAIVSTRLSNGPFSNLILGIMCGILMYVAVKTFAESGGNPLFAMMPVAIFILAGFNHCVADMFYGWWYPWYVSPVNDSLNWAFHALLPTTIGNVIGCNIIPLGLRLEYHQEPQRLHTKSKTQSPHDNGQ